MNARQKAKYYKRKYEQLAKKPVQFKVERYAVDTLRYARFIPEPLGHNTNYIHDVLAKDLSFKIAEQLKDYVEYTFEFEPHLNQYKLDAQVRVVRKYDH